MSQSSQDQLQQKPLRKCQSLPHLPSRHDSGIGFSGGGGGGGGGGGSCSILDQIGNSAIFHQHKHEKVVCNNRLVADFRQLLTLRQHYYPEGGWGWLLIVIGCIVQCISHGLHLSIGILINEIVHQFGQDHTNAVLLCALSWCSSLFFSPITISLCKRKSTRLIAVIGGLVTALGCLFTSFASQFHQMFFSFGIIVGVGVGITRDCSTLMVAQYFKKKREIVEIFIVGGSGFGIIFMSILMEQSLTIMGWRLGLQIVTAVVFLTFILGLFYRSASLYHPQRRAILHLKNQKRKVKDKYKQNRHPPFYDFKTLRSKTVRIILLSSAISSLGIYTPIFCITQLLQLDYVDANILLLQTYMGLGWLIGCVIFGFLSVHNGNECRISKQYLCQASLFMCGLCMLALTGVNQNFEGYVMFVWIYGIFCGGYNYSLKMYTYERVRARNFARAWSFVQFSQSIPICIGMPFVAYLNEHDSMKSGYVFSCVSAILGSLALFLVDLHKRNITHHEHTRSNGTRHLCMANDCPQNNKRLSFSQEPEHDPPIALANTNIIFNSEVLIHQLSDDIHANNEQAKDMKPELTCISEEGIADMDLPDNLFQDFDYIGIDCITSCNKVENYLMLSEFENNLNIEIPNKSDRNDKYYIYNNSNERN